MRRHNPFLIGDMIIQILTISKLLHPQELMQTQPFMV